MNLFKYKLILLIGFIVLAGSCKKSGFFELERPAVAPWPKLSALELAVMAPYHQFYMGRAPWGPTTWSSPLGQFYWYDFASSDVSRLIPGVRGQADWDWYYNRAQRTTSITGVQAFSESWTQLYRTIVASNDPLDFIVKAEEKGERLFPEVTQEEYDAKVPTIKGELHFMRAYAYWFLVQIFAPPYVAGAANSDRLLPLKSEFISDPEKIRNTPLGSTQEVYDLIVSDFIKAKEFIPKTFRKEGRANYWAATAFLSRVYFQMGQHDKALAEADELISSGEFSLEQEPITAFDRNPGESSSEIIFDFASNPNSAEWEMPFTNFTKVGYPVGRINGGRGVEGHFVGPWVTFVMSNSIIKYVDWMNDPENGDYTPTANALADKRYSQVYWRADPYVTYENRPAGMDSATYLDSYVHQNPVKDAITVPSIFLDKYYRADKAEQHKIPLIRYAEILLTHAILNFRKGGAGVEEAREKVNIIRRRAGLEDIASGMLTEEMIHKERVKELTGEGDRLRYLMSLGLPIPSGDRPGIAPAEAPYSSWYWNVPLAEMDLNGSYPK